VIDIVDKIKAGKKIEAKNGHFEQKAHNINNINNLHKGIERFKKVAGRNTQALQRSLIVGQIWDTIKIKEGSEVHGSRF